jgi:Paf1
MDVGILKPQEEASFGSEWVFSTYIPDASVSPTEIQKHLSSTDPDSAPDPYTYVRVRDYEGNLVNPPVRTDYAVYFVDSPGAAYYVGMSGKSNLKRRRTGRGDVGGGEERPDVIQLTLRGETAEERDVVEMKRREFEEGGPQIEEEDVESLARQVEVETDDEFSD